MLIDEVLLGIKYELVCGTLDKKVVDIVCNSKDVSNGCMFVAVVGNRDDGHNYIDKAIKNGASVILVSKDIEIDKKDITVIRVKNTRKILSKLAMKLYRYPQNKLKTIAITGTKGKTTTSFMIKKIIEEAGYKCGLIGTTGVYIGDKYYPCKNTTPESVDIIKIMDCMVNAGIEYMVMEVSSQALRYDRVNDIIFDYGIFTNLTKDHIGEEEHKNMNDYIRSKAKLFSQCNYGILNMDSEYFYDMITLGDCSINTYGYNEGADLKCKDIKLVRDGSYIGIELVTSGIVNDTFKISMPGRFSSYNAMAAIMVACMLKIDVCKIKKALSNFSVKGRVESVMVSDEFSLLIDYAHNGVSTQAILSTIREYAPKRIVTIFGCGGNRSRDRRYDMGEIAGKYSDFCIITEDNNRYEEFDEIVKDILVGIKKTKCKYKIIPDRKEAIKYAIVNGIKGDVIMLLGKGHEDYKEIRGVRYPFDERIVIKDILNELSISK